MSEYIAICASILTISCICCGFVDGLDCVMLYGNWFELAWAWVQISTKRWTLGCYSSLLAWSIWKVSKENGVADDFFHFRFGHRQYCWEIQTQMYKHSTRGLNNNGVTIEALAIKKSTSHTCIEGRRNRFACTFAFFPDDNFRLTKTRAKSEKGH